MVQQHGGNILAPDARIDARGTRRNAQYVAKEVTRHIQRMYAKIFDDEPLSLRQIGLAREHVVGRTERNTPQNGAPIAPLSMTCFTLWIGDCQRKFSCTISGTLATSQAKTMAFASFRLSAKGFWQITGILSDAANSTNDR